ncbi:MAG TPA: hypothetical protein VEO95_08335 [Chthoniobacteraceae bacterium]|nr:hypothetical protein [Chthoniobacteraceae bacterium]
MIAHENKPQDAGQVLEYEPQSQAGAAFVDAAAQLPKPDAAMRVRIAKRVAHGIDHTAQLTPLGFWALLDE